MILLCTVALNHRVAKYVIEDPDDVSWSCPTQIICVLDLLIHLPYFYGILTQASSNEDDRHESSSLDLTDEFKRIFDQAMTHGLETTINVKPLLLKMEERTGRNYLSEYFDPVSFSFIYIFLLHIFFIFNRYLVHFTVI